MNTQDEAVGRDRCSAGRGRSVKVGGAGQRLTMIAQAETNKTDLGGGEGMKKKRGHDGGVPVWAWCITWGIMLAGVVLNIIGIAGLLIR